MPEVVSMMYGRIFEAAPEARALFKGDIEEQMQRYGKMLQAIVKLTRSSHLWPVRAFTGEASLPFLDKMGTIHADAGVTLAHVNLMKKSCRNAARKSLRESSHLMPMRRSASYSMCFRSL